MRLFLWILIMMFSIDVFSQSNDKDFSSLIDSLDQTDLSGNLYLQIESLKREKLKYQENDENAQYEHDRILEFCIRQDVYRNLFDQLESSSDPDYQSLTDYYHQIGRSSLFEIPDSGGRFPVKIYYQELLRDTMGFSKDAFGGIEMNDFGQRISVRDPLLRKRYPRVYKMIANGDIILKMDYLGPQVPREMQIQKWKFPTLRMKENTLASKNALATELLNFISNEARSFVLMRSSQRNMYDGDSIIEEYLKLEEEKYLNASIDKKIELRRKFIEYLKTKYE